MRSERVLPLLLLWALLVSGPAQAAEETVSFTDDLGQAWDLAPPKRVAALIGSFADIWCLAGGEDTLVAAADDAWTGFELALGEDVVNLGGVSEPNAEKLLAARPDLVLASVHTQADLLLRESLTKAGIPAVFFDVESLEDYLAMLEVCTRLTGHLDNYDLYGTRVAVRCQAAIDRQDGSAPRVLCMRATGVSCKVKGSGDFVLGEMLADLGCVNVADGDSSLLESLTLEAILQADPDWIFVVLQGSDPAAATETLQNTLLSQPAWQSLRAVREGRFYTLPQRLYNLKPNARWGEAYETLAEVLYGP